MDFGGRPTSRFTNIHVRSSTFAPLPVCLSVEYAPASEFLLLIDLLPVSGRT